MSVNVSDRDDQGSITNTEVDAFPYPIANRRSIPDDEIGAYVPDSGSQGSIPGRLDFSVFQNTCNLSAVLSEVVNPFSNKQASMLNSQFSSSNQQASEESVGSRLSQDTVAILQQFSNHGPVTEQPADAPRCRLEDNLSLHFVNTDVADKAQNENLLNNMEEVLNSDATEEMTQKMRLNVVRGYLQRRPRGISPPSTEPPLCTGNGDFTIRDLLVMIPAHLWPVPELSFPCQNSHCHSSQEATEAHLLQH
jgi:hypothetical protein